VPHSPLPPPREPKPAHTGAISISSASSPQRRLISFTAFPLTASDVLHARLYCSLGGSACSCRITTPLASRATSLHIVALHAVQLLLRFQLPNLCSPGLAASLPHSHTRVRATWAYSYPGRATRARANRASSALRARYAQHLSTPPTSIRHRVHARATSSASLTFAPALPVNRLSVRSLRAASSARPQHQLSLLPAPLPSRRGAARAWPASPAPAQACTAPVSSACLRSLQHPPPSAARTPGRCRSGPCASRRQHLLPRAPHRCAHGPAPRAARPAWAAPPGPTRPPAPAALRLRASRDARRLSRAASARTRAPPGRCPACA
jgi:hypothetical protein